MKKTIILFLILSAISMKGYSQLAVTDPGVTAATTTGNSIQTISQTIQKIMASTQLALLDNSFFSDLGTTVEILDYIDKIACQTAELKFNYKYSKNYSCLTMLNMGDITMNINFASSIMAKLFTAADITAMSKEGRIKTMTDILTMLKNISSEIGEMNMTISGYLSTKIAKDYLKQQYFESTSYSVGDRYKKTDIK